MPPSRCFDENYIRPLSSSCSYFELTTCKFWSRKRGCRLNKTSVFLRFSMKNTHCVLANRHCKTSLRQNDHTVYTAASARAHESGSDTSPNPIPAKNVHLRLGRAYRFSIRSRPFVQHRRVCINKGIAAIIVGPLLALGKKGDKRCTNLNPVA